MMHPIRVQHTSGFGSRDGDNHQVRKEWLFYSVVIQWKLLSTVYGQALLWRTFRRIVGVGLQDVAYDGSDQSSAYKGIWLSGW